MYKYFIGFVLGLTLCLGLPGRARAFAPGVHVLRPEEIADVVREFAPYREADQPLYVTIPFTLDDCQRTESWQQAFLLAGQNNVVPLVRLATRFNSTDQAWQVPTRRDIVDLANALGQLSWPQNEKHVIVFNEPNHAAEWGGRLDPHEFARVTNFALNWFVTENSRYILLPAALDLAATDTPTTKEALAYWREVLGSKPEILDQLSAWNSHSYPNPGFVSSPERRGQNSLRGFEYELAFLKNYSDRQWEVYVTETGWDSTPRLQTRLKQYYLTAAKQIWNSPSVKAVTPFVFAGSPGPFAGFSFFAADGQPTQQWEALTAMLTALNQTLLTDRSATIPPTHQ